MMAKIDDYRFEKTLDIKTELNSLQEHTQTVAFNGITFKQAMIEISKISNVPIVWAEALDEKIVVGKFENVTLPILLESLGRRINASVTNISGVYFVGEIKKEDTVSAIVRMIPVNPEELVSAFDGVKTEFGVINIVGSVIWISDRLENVRKMINDIEIIRDKNSRSYIAEVYFVRVKEDDFIKVTGDLRINAVDVFSSSFNMNQLFSMFVDGDASVGGVSVDQRPVLYLSEGREAKFEVGSEIVREKKAVNKEGITETTGYEKFNDGIALILKLSKVSDSQLMLDFDLTVSFFDSGDTASIPKLNKSVLQSPGLLLTDTNVHYIGSLQRKENRKIFSIFGVDNGKATDFLTIWVRVREVKNG